jgi:nucleotide-binding universal stress UspA family protein
MEVIVPGMDAYAPLDMTPLIDSVKTEGQKGLKKAVALAARKKIRVDAAMVRSRGLYVSEVILDDARKWRADLIVMGTHGRRGFNRLLMGSDAERVLRDAPVPLLLVRADDSKESTGKRKRGPRTRRSV